MLCLLELLCSKGKRLQQRLLEPSILQACSAVYRAVLVAGPVTPARGSATHTEAALATSRRALAMDESHPARKVSLLPLLPELVVDAHACKHSDVRGLPNVLNIGGLPHAFGHSQQADAYDAHARWYQTRKPARMSY